MGTCPGASSGAGTGPAASLPRRDLPMSGTEHACWTPWISHFLCFSSSMLLTLHGHTSNAALLHAEVLGDERRKPWPRHCLPERLLTRRQYHSAWPASVPADLCPPPSLPRARRRPLRRQHSSFVGSRPRGRRWWDQLSAEPACVPRCHFCFHR